MITEAGLMHNWIAEAGRKDPLFSKEKAPIQRWGRSRNRIVGDHFLSIENGNLVYETPEGKLILSRFVGKRKDLPDKKAVFLLNGDGLTDIAERLQTSLRDRVTRTRNVGVTRLMIVPFMALDSSQIDYESIEPIEISRDKWEIVKSLFIFPQDATPTFFRRGVISRDMTQLFIDNGFTRERNGVFIKSGVMVGFNSTWERNQSRATRLIVSRNGRWHRISRENDKYFIHEDIHHLGASVFYAIGSDGSRHRYISAFDENEGNNFYYLAQLPDEGVVTNYREAINLLAPPIVHKAREEGRTVHRQGDIFFVETNLTHKNIGGTISRRDDVIRGELTKSGRPSRKRNQKRVVETDKSSTIMIYGTGHTADEVIQTDKGTFVRGNAYHDPYLEEENREPEHRIVALGKKSWFLCVRNTVPRQGGENNGDSN